MIKKYIALTTDPNVVVAVQGENENEARAAAYVTLLELPPEKTISITALQELIQIEFFDLTDPILYKREM